MYSINSTFYPLAPSRALSARFCRCPPERCCYMTDNRPIHHVRYVQLYNHVTQLLLNQQLSSVADLCRDIRNDSWYIRHIPKLLYFIGGEGGGFAKV